MKIFRMCNICGENISEENVVKYFPSPITFDECYCPNCEQNVLGVMHKDEFFDDAFQDLERDLRNIQKRLERVERVFRNVESKKLQYDDFVNGKILTPENKVYDNIYKIFMEQLDRDNVKPISFYVTAFDKREHIYEIVEVDFGGEYEDDRYIWDGFYPHDWKEFLNTIEQLEGKRIVLLTYHKSGKYKLTGDEDVLYCDIRDCLEEKLDKHMICADKGYRFLEDMRDVVRYMNDYL